MGRRDPSRGERCPLNRSRSLAVPEDRASRPAPGTPPGEALDSIAGPETPEPDAEPGSLLPGSIQRRPPGGSPAPADQPLYTPVQNPAATSNTVPTPQAISWNPTARAVRPKRTGDRP